MNSTAAPLKFPRRPRIEFESLAETTSIAIFLTQDQRIVYANPAATTITGYSYDELLGQDLWQLAHPDYQAGVKKLGMAQAWVKNVPSRYELKIVTKGGDERWLDLTMSEVDYGGEPAVAVTAFDITERDRAERALRASQRELEARVQARTAELAAANNRLISVLNSIAEAFVAFDSNWRFLAMNPMAEDKIFGRPVSELIGKVIWAEYPQTIGGDVHQNYQRAVETGQPVHFETPSRIVPGHWFEVHAYPHRNGLEAYFRDITDRKQADAEIANLARFPAENPNPVLRLNQDGDVLYANEAGQTLLKTWARTTGDLALNHWRTLAVNAMASHDRRNVEIVCDGRTYSISITPIVEAGYVNLYGHDITERQRAQAALRESEERFRSLFETMNEGFILAEVVTDNQGKPVDYRYLDVNPAGERFFGRSRDEIVGHTYKTIGGANADPEWIEALCQVALTGEPASIERYAPVGGQWVHLLAYSPRSGQFAAIFGNITERKRAESALQTTLERFYTILSNLYSSVLLVTDEGRVEFANQQFCDFYGLVESPADLVGISSRDMIEKIQHAYRHPDEAIARIQEIVDRGQPVRGEELVMQGGQTCLRDFVPVSIQGESYGRLWVHYDITAHKRAEERLAFQANILSNVSDVIYATDLQLQVTYWNHAAEKLYGWKQADVLGKSIVEITHSKFNPEARARLTRELIEKGLVSAEIEHQTRSGKLVVFESNTMALRTAAGNVNGFVAINRDITERRQAHEDLRISEARFRVALQSAPITVSTLDRDLRYTWVYNTRHGFRPEDVLGKRPDELIPPAEAAELMAVLNQALESGTTIRREVSGHTGDVRWIYDMTAEPLRDAGGQVIGLTMANIDIAERKRMEEALRNAQAELEQRVQDRTWQLAQANELLSKEIVERQQAEDQLRLQMTAVRAAANGIVITDRSGTIQWCNPAFTRMTGYDTDEILGRDFRLLNSGRQSAEFYRQMWATILAGDVWQGEIVNRRKDGRVYIEEQTIAPVLDAHGAITHFIAIKYDITERKQTETRLERYMQDLLAVSEAERAQRQLAETLSAAGLALTQSLNLDTVLQALLDHVAQLVPYDSANVMLLESESRLAVRVARGYERWCDPAAVRALTFAVQTNRLLEDLLTTRQSCLIVDTRFQPDWEIRPGVEHVRSWLGVPLVAGGHVIGLYSLDKTEPGYFTPEHQRLAELLVGQAAVAIQNAWLFEQVRAGRERLQSLSRRLVEAQEAERQYVARELHDEAGQALTSLLFGLRQLEPQLADPAQAAQVAELKQITNGLFENLHRLAADLRPASLDHLGLVPVLQQYLKVMGERYGLIAQFKAVGFDGERLSAEIETALYRIVQEALTNIGRHAHATRADVLLERRDGRVVVVVEDNGLGFDAAISQFAQAGHLGLAGMQERVEMLGGSLTIESAAGAGTTIVVEVPNDDSNSNR